MGTSEEPARGGLSSVRAPTGRPDARWRFWRSPPAQPPWARPVLLGIACIAGLAYAWGADSADLEPFYGAAARSMSSSWHDFFFGAFDPMGTITVDKLPGALWLQALSLRILGFHVWAVVLPQILEGIATILVLYRAVRRLAGPVAGITAALVLAISPVTVALNRGNVSDSLLILLTVLAADATSCALLSGRLRTLLLAGVWVGLAFQAKMLQAWLVLPALALAYIVAAPPRLRVRIGHVALAGVVTAVVSLSWMIVVSLVPASERPYVDGTHNDSVFSQVFEYNGIARVGGGTISTSAGPTAKFLVKLGEEGGGVNSQSAKIKPSWHRLLGGLFGRDDGWLLPVALIGGAAAVLGRRRTSRRDPMRASVLLWGTWLAVLAVVFSKGVYLNSYYVAALSPATAALCGVGVVVFWDHRQRWVARAGVLGTLLACVGYDAYLLKGASAVPGWLLPAALCLAIAGVLASLPPYVRDRPARARSVVALAVTCALVVPAVTSVLVVTREIGPFAAPYEPATQAPPSLSAERAGAQLAVARLSSTYHTPIVFAADTSSIAATYIYYTGREILPIGGYWGGVPAPTLTLLQRDVASSLLRAFLVPVRPPSGDPRIVWVQAHCAQVGQLEQSPQIRFGIYDCRPGARSVKTG